MQGTPLSAANSRSFTEKSAAMTSQRPTRQDHLADLTVASPFLSARLASVHLTYIDIRPDRSRSDALRGDGARSVIMLDPRAAAVVAQSIISPPQFSICGGHWTTTTTKVTFRILAPVLGAKEATRPAFMIRPILFSCHVFPRSNSVRLKRLMASLNCTQAPCRTVGRSI